MKSKENEVMVGNRTAIAGILRLNAMVFGLVSGLLLGLILFAATIWLVIKGGDPVGPHLGLLRQYFVGYSVTIHGSLIGFSYGFICGYIIGWLLGWIYNKLVVLRIGDFEPDIPSQG